MNKHGCNFHLVVNPQEGVNDTEATLVEWQVKDGEMVVEGQVLCVLETTKAAYEVVAPAPGVIKVLTIVGEKAAVNQEVAVIFDTQENFSLHSESVYQEFKEKYCGSKIQVTEKARKLAESLGVDVSKIRTQTGIVKEKDVRDYQERLPEANKVSLGRVKEEFVQALEKDPSVFKNLSSQEKVRIYRENGAVIGDDVLFGPGALIVAKFIEVGEGTAFGEGASIKAERFRIGKIGVIGAHANFVTRSIWIGDVFYSGNQFIVGGGGAFGKNSEFRCGDNCLISSQCIINTSEPVVFGDEVGLSPRAQIYTHSHWQDIFEGYAASFGPVTIGDHSYVTGNAMIVPGVTVGRGCTILANSVVTSNVDDRCVVAGVPAKVVRHIEADTPIEKKDRIMQRLLPELRCLLSEQKLDPDGFVYEVEYRGKIKKGVVLTFLVNDVSESDQTTVFDFSQKQITGPQNRYTDEIRNFFRKRGVRFKPYLWRYTHDVGLFNQ